MVALKQQLSSWKVPMRLVRDDDDAPVTQGRERRIFPRRQIQLTVPVKRLDHSIPARRQPMVMLDVRDVSIGGMSALADAPLAPGERIAVTFPAHGLRMGWDACGHVLRCEASALGYRVAVEFESLPSAA